MRPGADESGWRKADLCKLRDFDAFCLTNAAKKNIIEKHENCPLKAPSGMVWVLRNKTL